MALVSFFASSTSICVMTRTPQHHISSTVHLLYGFLDICALPSLSLTRNTHANIARGSLDTKDFSSSKAEKAHHRASLYNLRVTSPAPYTYPLLARTFKSPQNPLFPTCQQPRLIPQDLLTPSQVLQLYQPSRSLVR